MKLVSYLKEGHDQLALMHNNLLYDTDKLHPDFPSSMNMLLIYWDDNFENLYKANKALANNEYSKITGTPIDSVALLAPIPFPSSCRDGYAFRQHVAAARRNRGVEMIAAFDEFPIFYFTNHHSIQGPGKIYCMPDHFQKLDFELEVAIVICRAGRNIRAEDADNYIGGLMIMNDMSARGLQMEEMQLNLGPAKGKDFSTVIGPYLVSLDELEQYEIPAKEGHTGKSWNLKMECTVNGKKVSEGNVGDMDWTFAEIIERCSYGVTLQPGDVIGSGTCGTGCFLELNGTGKLNDPNFTPQWLEAGDQINLTIDALGVLENTIEKEDSDFSLLAIKKNQEVK
ncbi:MAG: fumarylacetoacetate hydrolase family protein [Chitinophagaceae bacterium]